MTEMKADFRDNFMKLLKLYSNFCLFTTIHWIKAWLWFGHLDTQLNNIQHIDTWHKGGALLF